jgi:spore maturation protein CgeB
MKLMIVDTYYPAFLRVFYAEHPGLQSCPYAEQWRILMDQCFGTANFYSDNLRPLGFDAHEVVANCDPLQRRWAREHALPLWAAYPLYRRSGRVKSWQMAVLKAQVEKLRPDVLYVQDLNWMETPLLQAVRKKGRLIVGQTAYVLRQDMNWEPYDLIVSSFPHYVERFRQLGTKSEYLRFAFEARVQKLLGEVQPRHAVVFVGGYSPNHANGNRLLEHVAARSTVDFWGYGAESLPANSLVRRSCRGEAWGLQMYGVLAESRISLNRHIDVAGRFANNMRLFEATGVGTLLLTDQKDNLHQLFEVGKEVIAYSTPQECVELIAYYLDHEDERRAVARAGQERTLRDHTYQLRMKELAQIVREHQA